MFPLAKMWSIVPSQHGGLKWYHVPSKLGMQELSYACQRDTFFVSAYINIVRKQVYNIADFVEHMITFFTHIPFMVSANTIALELQLKP